MSQCDPTAFPAAMRSTVPSQPATAWEDDASLSTTSVHHTATRNAATASGEGLCLSLPHNASPSAGPSSRARKGGRSPSKPRPPRLRHRRDDDVQLPARVQSCKAELIPGRRTERKLEALTGHDQDRPEELRHIVMIPQDEDVLDPNRQVNLGGQNLELLSSHPARPGPFGNHVDLLFESTSIGISAASAVVASAIPANAIKAR